MDQEETKKRERALIEIIEHMKSRNLKITNELEQNLRQMLFDPKITVSELTQEDIEELEAYGCFNK